MEVQSPFEDTDHIHNRHKHLLVITKLIKNILLQSILFHSIYKTRKKLNISDTDKTTVKISDCAKILGLMYN